MRTIQASGDIDRLFREGRRSSGRFALVVAGPSDEQAGRVAFVAGRRIGGAVQRNRAKRVLRAACRRARGPWAGRDVLFVARSGICTAASDEVDAALSKALTELGVLR